MKNTPSTATARGVRVLLATIVGVLGLSFNAAADEKSVAIHMVKATGPGWSADRRVRATLEKIEGIDKLFVTGSNAWFSVKEGEMVTEEAVKGAITSDGALGFTSHEVVEMPKPTSAWVIPTGYGWAATSAKVGLALEEVEGVSLAFVDKERIVILCTTEEPSVEALTSALAAFDAKPDGMTRDDSLLFWVAGFAIPF